MRVGTSILHLAILRLVEDHPHACGDKLSLCLLSHCCTGSSPCVWGQATQTFAGQSLHRIIPMRVGTSCTGLCECASVRDHPHACGDKFIIIKSMFIISGSSPCVWGQGKRFVCVARIPRIIPMRVGTRVYEHSIAVACKDHPHACGDKLPRLTQTLSGAGSSPCVWGQGRAVVVYRRTTGIIPMRVGTSLFFLLPFGLPWDHPHACGDKLASPLSATL